MRRIASATSLCVDFSPAGVRREMADLVSVLVGAGRSHAHVSC